MVVFALAAVVFVAAAAVVQVEKFFAEQVVAVVQAQFFEAVAVVVLVLFFAEQVVAVLAEFFVVAAVEQVPFSVAAAQVLLFAEVVVE